MAGESQRQASSLPKKNSVYTLDWYVKWVASALVLTAMSIRGVDGYGLHDLVLSTVGIFLWLIVALLWKDRALILLNGCGLLFLIRNLFQTLS
jgi:hypothetical protein